MFLELFDYVMKHEFLALFLYFLSKYDTKFETTTFNVSYRAMYLD